MFKIDNNVPIPGHKAGTKEGYKYPFNDMRVGDSFLVQPDPVSGRNKIAAACSQHSKRHGGKFITRKTPEGIRIWRVE